MNVNNRNTPLSALRGLKNEDILTLRARWIFSVEELYGYIQALAGDAPAGREDCESLLGPEVCKSMSTVAIPARKMGLAVSDAEVKATVALCGRQMADSKHVSGNLALSRGPGGGCPPAVRLMDRMRPIRDQGSRGTCTAFASTALCEFVYGGNLSFSPQFLYWASKKLDQSPHSDGVPLAVVQDVLAEEGVCEERFWNYQPEPRFVDGQLDAGQGPAPKEAVDDARNHRMRSQTLAPKAVDRYRRQIASGYPVVVGVLVFDSWARNVITEKTGRVFMPHMVKNDDGCWELREECRGAHAMCLVGYVDSDSVPGGGYFIARNSWGAGWAAECTEGAGHALIPYRYVDFFALSAFTLDGAGDDVGRAEIGRDVLVAGQNQLSPMVPKHLVPYARKSIPGERDFNNRLLPKGTIVLSLNPGAPLYEFSVKNSKEPGYVEILTDAEEKAAQETAQRQEQARLAKEQARLAKEQARLAQIDNAFPVMSNSELNVLLQRKKNYSDKVMQNFSCDNLRMRALPTPSCFWEVMSASVGPGIKTCKEVVDFSQEVAAMLERYLLDSYGRTDGIPLVGGLEQNELPRRVRDTLSSLVMGKVMRVSSYSPFNRPVYVVLVFVVPFAFDVKTKSFGATCATDSFLIAVDECVKAQLAKCSMGNGGNFCAIGIGMPAESDLAPCNDGKMFATVSWSREDGGWEVRRSIYLRERTAYRDFCDRLMPLTEGELLSEVRKIVDPNLLFPGTCNSPIVYVREDIIPKLREKYPGFPDVRQTAVIGVLRQMQGENPRAYVTMRNAKGEVFVAAPPGKVLDGDEPLRRLSWFTRFLVFYLAHVVCWSIGVAGIVVRQIYGTDVRWVRLLPLLIVPALLSFAIQSMVKKIAIIERE